VAVASAGPYENLNIGIGILN